jgi:hypothetical protein
LEILQSCKGNPSIVIVGDFNCHNANWLDSKDINGNPKTNLAVNSCFTFVTENALGNLVFANTYLRNSGQFKSLRDLVITDIPKVCHIEYETPIGKSPHVTIVFNVKLSTKKDKPYFRTKWLYHKADWEKVNHSITTPLTNISSYTIKQDVNETWSYIKSSIHNAMNEHIPKRIIKRSPRDKPWFTDDCAIACDQKSKAYKKYRASGTDTDKQVYQKSIDTTQAIYKRAQEQYKIKI